MSATTHVAQRRPTPPHAIRRIAVFRALHLGDLLLAVPALRALRSGFPEAEITLIGLPWATSLVARYPHYLDRFVAFGGYSGIAEVPYDERRSTAFLATQRAAGYDLVLQLHGSGRTSNALALALGGRLTAAYYPEAARPDGLTFAAPYPDRAPEVERNLDLVRLLGLPAGDVRLEFPLYAADHAEADALLQRLPVHHGPRIALHPGAHAPARRWPVEHVAALGDLLTQRLHAQVLLTGGPDDTTTVDAVRRRMSHPAPSLTGQTSLGGLGALLTSVALFIGNDSGPAHLAEAVGTPSITLFGPADPARWAPLDQSRHRILHHAVACSPCGFADCPLDHRCLRTISPQQVLQLATTLLSEGLVACNA